jgi:hypothetical protein
MTAHGRRMAGGRLDCHARGVTIAGTPVSALGRWRADGGRVARGR